MLKDNSKMSLELSPYKSLYDMIIHEKHLPTLRMSSADISIFSDVLIVRQADFPVFSCCHSNLLE